jgi:ferredoxin
MAGAPDLTPCSFDVMLDRVAHEWGSQRRVFDLPTARFWSPHPETDLSMDFLGRPAATPVGPAAGPHSQMVRNLADWHHYNWLEARTAGYRGPVEAHMRAILDGSELDLYSYSGNQKTPRRLAHELQMWGCVACNFCVTVCPNDAFFSISTPEGSGLEGRQQYMVLAELCNDCGNCMTFCPEDGDPAQVKPKLFLTRERFDMAEGQGFLPQAENGRVDVTSKPESERESEHLVSVINNEEGIPVGVNLH